MDLKDVLALEHNFKFEKVIRKMNDLLQKALNPTSGFKNPTTLPLEGQAPFAPQGIYEPVNLSMTADELNKLGTNVEPVNKKCPPDPCGGGHFQYFSIKVEKKQKTCYDLCRDKAREEEQRAQELRAAAYNWLKCQGVEAVVRKPLKKKRGKSGKSVSSGASYRSGARSCAGSSCNYN